MKKGFVLFGVMMICLTLTAGPKDEALSSLDTAKGFVSGEQYSKAVDEINYALAKINEILAQKLLALIPEAPAGYTRESTNSTGLGTAGSFMGSANSLTADASYNNPSGSYINLTITVGGFIGQAASFANMGQMFGGAVAGSSTIRIKGYTGTLEYDQENQSGTLSVKVGDDKSVIIEGSQIESGDILKALAEKMDLARLEREL